MIDNKFQKIIETYSGVISLYTDKFNYIRNTLFELRHDFREEMMSEFNELLKENRFFQTNDGYIAVNAVNSINVSGLAQIDPIVVLEGFYIRGIDCKHPAKYPYGYYDSISGHLLSALKPITPEIFCEKAKTVLLSIIDNLYYKPTYLYREEGDTLSQFIDGARRANIDVEYYPEVKITIIP